jgi:hypothetical protein
VLTRIINSVVAEPHRIDADPAPGRQNNEAQTSFPVRRMCKIQQKKSGEYLTTSEKYSSIQLEQSVSK